MQPKLSMHNFYLSKISNEIGDFEIHTGTCVFLPRVKSDCIALGSFDTSEEAVEIATEFCESPKCCFFCCHKFDS